ncbi:MAG: hypothetical protein HFJ17_05500 [Clostridia bacterium]|nr:hypothetical protein [Clostridia bacterium]
MNKKKRLMRGIGKAIIWVSIFGFIYLGGYECFIKVLLNFSVLGIFKMVIGIPVTFVLTGIIAIIGGTIAAMGSEDYE